MVINCYWDGQKVRELAVLITHISMFQETSITFISSLTSQSERSHAQTTVKSRKMDDVEKAGVDSR